MSSNAQAIFYFIAALGCLLAALWGFWTPANRAQFYLGFHPGWLGLSAFCFVFFWIAVKAS